MKRPMATKSSGLAEISGAWSVLAAAVVNAALGVEEGAVFVGVWRGVRLVCGGSDAEGSR